MRSSGTKDEEPNFDIMDVTELEQALGKLSADSWVICSNFETSMETGLLDRDPTGLDGLLWVIGLRTGLFGLDPDGDELDLLRPS